LSLSADRIIRINRDGCQKKLRQILADR